MICSLDISREFQSTRPMRGATSGLDEFSLSLQISIHAPHAGRAYERAGG